MVEESRCIPLFYLRKPVMAETMNWHCSDSGSQCTVDSYEPAILRQFLLKNLKPTGLTRTDVEQVIAQRAVQAE